jgi:transcription factor MBP1
MSVDSLPLTSFVLGTWVPLQDGKALADRNGVLQKLRPIFDFVPGEKSPPPAPKHATASSNKSRVNKLPVYARKTFGE